jgi:hypothetical protein
MVEQSFRLPVWAQGHTAEVRRGRKVVWISCESLTWVALLRRNLPDGIQLEWLSKAADLEHRISAGRPGFIFLEWQPEDTEGVIRLLRKIWFAPAPVPVVLLAKKVDPSGEFLLRSFGVWHLVRSPRQMPAMVPLILRYFQSVEPWRWAETETSGLQLPWQEPSTA